MEQQDIFKKHLRKATTRSYWLGVGLGLVFGILLGMAIGYTLGSPTTVVIPLTEGTKV
ncbi:MAG: hypothetical protein R3E64_10415 [Halioglobus sp.]